MENSFVPRITRAHWVDHFQTLGITYRQVNSITTSKEISIGLIPRKILGSTSREINSVIQSSTKDNLVNPFQIIILHHRN